MEIRVLHVTSCTFDKSFKPNVADENLDDLKTARQCSMSRGGRRTESGTRRSAPRGPYRALETRPVLNETGPAVVQEHRFEGVLHVTSCERSGRHVSR